VIAEPGLQQLAAHQGAPVVTSLYLDVDGRASPRRSDESVRLDNLCRVARRRADEVGTEARAAVDADLERIEAWLARFDRSSMRGVAHSRTAAIFSRRSFNSASRVRRLASRSVLAPA